MEKKCEEASSLSGAGYGLFDTDVWISQKVFSAVVVALKSSSVVLCNLYKLFYCCTDNKGCLSKSNECCTSFRWKVALSKNLSRRRGVRKSFIAPVYERANRTYFGKLKWAINERAYLWRNGVAAEVGRLKFGSSCSSSDRKWRPFKVDLWTVLLAVNFARCKLLPLFLVKKVLWLD